MKRKKGADGQGAPAEIRRSLVNLRGMPRADEIAAQEAETKRREAEQQRARREEERQRQAAYYRNHDWHSQSSIRVRCHWLGDAPNRAALTSCQIEAQRYAHPIEPPYGYGYGALERDLTVRVDYEVSARFRLLAEVYNDEAQTSLAMSHAAAEHAVDGLLSGLCEAVYRMSMPDAQYLWTIPFSAGYASYFIAHITTRYEEQYLIVFDCLHAAICRTLRVDRGGASSALQEVILDLLHDAFPPLPTA